MITTKEMRYVTPTEYYNTRDYSFHRRVIGQIKFVGIMKEHIASEEIVKIVIADALSAFFLTRSFGSLNQPGIPYKKQKNDRKQTIRFAVCDLQDELNFPPNIARSKVELG